jgi:hypothetical protein
VDRAIQVVEEALRRYGAPIYVRHEIVHNRTVVEQLKARGAIFVEELDEVPAEAQVVFSTTLPLRIRLISGYRLSPELATRSMWCLFFGRLS